MNVGNGPIRERLRRVDGKNGEKRVSLDDQRGVDGKNVEGEGGVCSSLGLI